MGTVTPLRRRDSARSRELLLQAADELFADHGFDRTTVRDIAGRAGVDPALIARYFGSKTGLYIATLQRDTGATPPPDLLAPGRLQQLLERLERRGAGPVLQAAVREHEDAAAQEAARAELQSRLVNPLAARLAAAGADRPQLRAEVAVAAFAGVALARSAGALDLLAAAGTEELVDLLTELLSAL